MQNGEVCSYCGAPAVVRDHILPLSRGGNDEEYNKAPACNLCNFEKSNLTVEEWREWRESQGKSWPPDWNTESIPEWRSWQSWRKGQKTNGVLKNIYSIIDPDDKNIYPKDVDPFK